MSADKDLGPHILDAGPVFCLGGSEYLADLYDRFFLADSQIVDAVANEVFYRGGQQEIAGNKDRKNELRRAAARAAVRYRDLLESSVERPDPVPQALTDLERVFKVRALAKGRVGFQHDLAHRGESESIHHAMRGTSMFLSCDQDAREVAEMNGIVVGSFVEIVRRIRRSDRSIKHKRLGNELFALGRKSIDIGEHFQGELDLR